MTNKKKFTHCEESEAKGCNKNTQANKQKSNKFQNKKKCTIQTLRKPRKRIMLLTINTKHKQAKEYNTSTKIKKKQ